MNTHTQYDGTSARIRSVDFNSFEKPAAKPHWSFDEKLRTRRAKRTIDLNTALRALAALAAAR